MQQTFSAIAIFAASLIAWLAGVASLSGTLHAQAAEIPASRTVWDGAFAPQQAQRGRAVYARDCETCHGPALDGGEAPALTGAEFLGEWYGHSVGDLYERIRKTMPDTSPGSLSAQDYADVLAYVLSANKFPEGTTELAGSREALQQIRIETARPRP